MDFVNFCFNVSALSEIYPIIDVLKYKEVNSVYDFNCNYRERLSVYKAFNCSNIQVATLNDFAGLNTIPYSYSRVGILVNTACYNWTRAFSLFPETVAFKYQFKWLIYSDDLLTTSDILSNYSIEIDSDVTILIKSKDVVEFYEAFHTDYSNGPVTIKKVGYWNKQLCMNATPRRNLTGIVMKCPVVITEKIAHETFEEYLNKPKTTQVDSLHKLKFFALLNYIRDIYNFSYSFQRTNSWGYIRNGSFDGIAGALQRNEADVGGSPLFFRADRAKLIDYIAETWQSRQCFILRHPKHPGGIFTIYTRPLDATVWGCILAMLAFSGAILYLMLKTKSPNSGSETTDYSFSLALLFHWSAICQQGMSIHRTSTSVKIVVFVTFVYALTLYQYYNAMVVSTLLREPPKNIRSLEDLLKSNMKAGAENVLYTKDYFKRTTDPVALRMYYKRIVPEQQYNFYSAEPGMALVKQGGFAFHVDSVVAYRIMRSKFTEREICEAQEVLLYPPQKMAVVVRKSSPYREHFTYAVRKLLETGVMNRLQTLWDEPKPRCVHTPDTSVFSVSIREFSTALMALLTGTLAAVVILLLEILVYRCQRTHIAFTH